MRVLFTAHGLPPERRAGVELYTDSLARALAARGHAVAVAVRGSAAAAPDSRAGYETIPLDVPRRKRRFLDLYDDPRVDAAFLEAARRFRPDVVHAQHLQGLSAGVVLAARATGAAAVVLSLHDFWLGCPRGQRVRADRGYCAEVDRERCARCLRPQWQGIHRDPKGLLRAARNLFLPGAAAEALAEYDALVLSTLGAASLVLTPSAFYRDEYIRWYGLDPARVRVVAPAPPHLVARAERGRAGRREAGEAFTVGYVGSLIPTKGVHVLAEAFARLDRPGFRLAIHGGALDFFGRKGGDYEDEIRAIARRSRSEIVLHGRYAPESLGAILASFDALALPSVWPESYSLTLREGWLAGVPVLASRLGALAESVRDGETGLLVEPGDPIAWRDAVLRLAADAPLRTKLSAAASREPIATMEAHAAEMEELYAGLAGGPARGG